MAAESPAFACYSRHWRRRLQTVPAGIVGPAFTASRMRPIIGGVCRSRQQQSLKEHDMNLFSSVDTRQTGRDRDVMRVSAEKGGSPNG